MFLDIIKQILGLRNKVIHSNDIQVTSITGTADYIDKSRPPVDRPHYIFLYQICIASDGIFKNEEVIKLEFRVKDVEAYIASIMSKQPYESYCRGLCIEGCGSTNCIHNKLKKFIEDGQL